MGHEHLRRREARVSQFASIDQGALRLQVRLPGPDQELMPGISWGRVDAFPTPAYWAYQVLARRILAPFKTHRLGRSLREEVVACLLGGYGLPAAVGNAAFDRLQRLGVLSGPASEELIYQHLCKPLLVNGRPVRYRFAKQKARYISSALNLLHHEEPRLQGGRALRDWLLKLPGIGPKTASWIARNWMDADDVAILDVHILKAGRLAGVFDASAKVERDYMLLEEQFLAFSHAMGLRPSELDAVIWAEMSASAATLQQLTERPDLRKRRTSQSKAHPMQARLID
jgi:N-glycosylase/DNA lyase